MLIKLPNNNKLERQYIIDIIFSDFLDLKYSIEFCDIADYQVHIENKLLIIKDNFFSKHSDNNYLSIKNIPDRITKLSKSDFQIENNLPIIFGDNTIEMSENELICGLDIFASSFFMLTRWEEYVIKAKDSNGRFADEQSLAFQFGFYKRAVVNEYVELLWNMLVHFGFNQKRKERKYNLFLTHDVDFFRRYDSTKKLAKAIGGDLLKRKSPKMAKETISTFQKIKSGEVQDPYDTFGFLMDISDKNNIKSHFYFIPAKLGEADAQYNIDDTEVIRTIERIYKREHIVGAHFGWDSFNDNDKMLIEQNRLADIIGDINESRQHFLRFENPKTWQILEQNNIKIDSTLGYTSDIGFRCGTCYEFSVFDIIERKKLNLKEYPLIVMDTALANSTKRNKEKFLSELYEINKTVKSFNGNFVFLWHQNNKALPEWDFVSDEYENIIENII